jgi:hypothetical protein
VVVADDVEELGVVGEEHGVGGLGGDGVLILQLCSVEAGVVVRAHGDLHGGDEMLHSFYVEGGRGRPSGVRLHVRHSLDHQSVHELLLFWRWFHI